MKALFVFLFMVALCTANKVPALGRVDGLLRAPIDISLAGSESTASSILSATCTGNTATITLTVTDPDDDLEKSSIVVGNSGDNACTQESAEATISVPLGTNACGRLPLNPDPLQPSTTYTWQVTVNHYLAAVDGISFGPLSTTHAVTCAVVFDGPDLLENEGPAVVPGGPVSGEGQTVELRLQSESTANPRLWQLSVTPVSDLPVGLSYKLTECTARPNGLTTPTLTLISPAGQDGKVCIKPKTGTKATYTVADNKYSLTIRAFNFAANPGNVDIQCTAQLCTPTSEGLCDGQDAELAECEPVVVPPPAPGARSSNAKSQLSNALVRHVRSAKQYMTSNVLVLQSAVKSM